MPRKTVSSEDPSSESEDGSESASDEDRDSEPVLGTRLSQMLHSANLAAQSLSSRNPVGAQESTKVLNETNTNAGNENYHVPLQSRLDMKQKIVRPKDTSVRGDTLKKNVE